MIQAFTTQFLGEEKFISKATVSFIQPFSQQSLTATVPKVFQIGLGGVVEADLELFCYSWSAGFLGERLYGHLMQGLDPAWRTLQSVS